MSKKKKKKRSGAKKRAGERARDVDPALMEAYYNDPIALWQDEEYEALDRLWRELYGDPQQNPIGAGAEAPDTGLDENGDIPF
jgi:hypothetical protein